jgi:uncharacterized membrane protein HdeD (DUF308 family)
MGNERLPAIKHVKWLGMALIALGVAAVLTPVVAGAAVVMVIGFILLIAGIVPIVRQLKAESSKERTLGLTLGIITALAGIAVIGHPLLGLGVLTLLLASGVMSLVLGLLIWRQWPVSGIWAVGVLVGVNLLGTVLALVTLASTLNKSLDPRA